MAEYILTRNCTNGRRDELRIMADVLLTLRQPRRLTHILYKTNLSSGQLRKYLSSLIHMRLAEEIPGQEPYRVFRVTEKGISFLNIIGADGNSRFHELDSEPVSVVDGERGD